MTKIDIFSGFLGAGKTTLIKKLIKEAYAGEKLVLIENEFGDIGIDGGFMKEAGITVNEINSGCICCSLVGDFGDALKKVMQTYSPDRIIIEPSGVGKLSDIVEAIKDAQLEGAVINSASTIVDATKCKIYMKNFGEFFNNQIECTKCIILSHTANMSEEKLATAIGLIREKNSDAVIITTQWDKLDGKQILSAIENTDTMAAYLEELAKAVNDEEECHCHHHHHHDEDEEDECHCHHHHHDEDEEGECHCHHHDEEEGEHHHHHHHHHHGHDADEVFTSWGRETAKSFTKSALEKILAELQNEEKYGTVLRAKGIVPCAECDKWIHFDYVPGEADIRTGAAMVTGRICVIGSKLNEDALSQLFGV